MKLDANNLKNLRVSVYAPLEEIISFSVTANVENVEGYASKVNHTVTISGIAETNAENSFFNGQVNIKMKSREESWLDTDPRNIGSNELPFIGTFSDRDFKLLMIDVWLPRDQLALLLSRLDANIARKADVPAYIDFEIQPPANLNAMYHIIKMTFQYGSAHGIFIFKNT